MTLEQATQLYATVLRQLLPVGGYDTAPNTVVAADVYAHAKVLAQADLDAKRLLKVLEGIPTELLSEYEYDYGLPLKCTVNATKSIEERLQILNWFKNTENVFNHAYLKQLLAIFGIELFELLTYRPIQCTAPCTAPVNTEQLRYKVRIIIPEPVPADIQCIIENYLPAYLRVDVIQHATMKESVLNENVATFFALLTATLESTDPYRSTTISPENVNTTFSLISASQRTALVSNITQPENVATFFALAGAQITKGVSYLSKKIEVENVSTQFTLTGAQITN